VIEPRESGLKAIVQIVPRIDLSLHGMDKEEAKRRKKSVRPPKRVFNASEVHQAGGTTSNGKLPGYDVNLASYGPDFFSPDGFLVREVAVGTVAVPITEESKPTLEELQDFRKKKADAGDEVRRPERAKQHTREGVR
jgi:hypothetical protein